MDQNISSSCGTPGAKWNGKETGVTGERPGRAGRGEDGEGKAAKEAAICTQIQKRSLVSSWMGRAFRL